MRQDFSQHQRIITRAALDQMMGFQKSPTGIDRTHPRVTFDNVLKGKLGEAAWAVHLGYGIEEILDDGPHRPDFEMKGWNLDVKTSQLTRRSINVRSYYLDKPDLDSWVILGALCDIDSWTVELAGSIRANRLSEWAVSDPESGHSTSFIRVPIDALKRVEE